MIRRRRNLVVIAIVAVALPLQRFFASPSFEVARVVDMLSLFVAGMGTGVILTSIGVLGRHARREETESSPEPPGDPSAGTH